jgi:hypothetical protein
MKEGRAMIDNPYVTQYSPIQPTNDDQYLETVRPGSKLGPEKSLMIAVLGDAVTCFQKHVFARTRGAKTIIRETEDWIFSDDEKSLFSYRNVCETLDIDYQRLREGLMEWMRRQAGGAV